VSILIGLFLSFKSVLLHWFVAMMTIMSRKAFNHAFLASVARNVAQET
jgi:hypothetical protein